MRRRTLDWYPQAVDELLAIPSTQDAAEVDRALQSFAATGRGFLRRIENEDGPDELWLYTSTRYRAAVQPGPERVLVLRIARRP